MTAELEARQAYARGLVAGFAIAEKWVCTEEEEEGTFGTYCAIDWTEAKARLAAALEPVVFEDG